MMSTSIHSRNGKLTDEVREVFAHVTRYPVDILEPHASLEEDLGIDSVKLGEVFAVLREKYGLVDNLHMQREHLRSISTIAHSLQEHLEQNSAAAPLPIVPVNGNGHAYTNGNGNGHAPQRAVAFSSEEFSNQVRDIFAQVTRYPADILEPHANLEEDLGIDSVKLGEVFAVLREKYDLPTVMDLPREQMKTIAGISSSLAQYVSAATSAAVPPPVAVAPLYAVPPSAPVVAAPPEAVPAALVAAPASGDFDEQVRAIFAQVTRYPIDILELTASLEEDLGIDSVKLGEVFAVLRERYHLPEQMDVPRESMKTIGSIADALRKYVATPAASVAPAATVSLNGHINGTGYPSNGNGYLNGNGHGIAGGFLPPALNPPATRPFEGKIALVTGSGRALGKDVAVYLASKGATVIVNSFHSREQGEKTVAEIIAAGGKAMHAWGSVANPQHVEAIFEQIEQAYGGLDFFVSNASNGMLARLEDLTPEHFEKAYRTNVIGLHQCSLRALNLMKRRGGGKIVTLSSPASHGYVDYFGCMATVKAAVESLTKTMAIEFARYNVQVNCVSPGPIYGDLLNKWPESKRLIAEWEQATVCDRLCVDRDVSHFIAFLLEDAVKLFTGSVLVMDGGISVRWGGVSGAAAESAKASAQSTYNQQPVGVAAPAYL
jgi:NAD(P)-dependent dehydrogenase (short-subunit alcohol dehydrogenase family)/acyl carrier protein